ncbi:MAG: hypothetical protein ACLTSL_13930 [Odoribacter splanchnicus]
MKHSEFIKNIIPIVQELQEKKENNISEKEIQDKIIERFNFQKHRCLCAKKEREGRFDIVIYHKDKPESIYELKTYFKATEKIRESQIGQIKKDLYKLYEQSNETLKAFFVMIISTELMEDLREKDPSNFLVLPHNPRTKIPIRFILKEFEIECRKRYDCKNFSILSWRIKHDK